jgi:hypothetical protein
MGEARRQRRRATREPRCRRCKRRLDRHSRLFRHRKCIDCRADALERWRENKKRRAADLGAARLGVSARERPEDDRKRDQDDEQ